MVLPCVEQQTKDVDIVVKDFGFNSYSEQNEKQRRPKKQQSQQIREFVCFFCVYMCVSVCVSMCLNVFSEGKMSAFYRQNWIQNSDLK